MTCDFGVGKDDSPTPKRDIYDKKGGEKFPDSVFYFIFDILGRQEHSLLWVLSGKSKEDHIRFVRFIVGHRVYTESSTYSQITGFNQG